MSAPLSSLPLEAISDGIANIVAAVSERLVAVHGRRRGTASGILWRSGLIITADEAMETDEDVVVTFSDGSQDSANLVGRDPSTDVALLRTREQAVEDAHFEPAGALRSGHLVIAAGRHPEGVSAILGVISLAGGPWKSLRGGHIDRRLVTDVRLDPRSEGGVAVDAQGRIIGMMVLGPRNLALVIPSETIERVAEQLLEKGRIPRGYLGLGLQPVWIDQAAAQSAGLTQPRGLIVISVDQHGPGHRAGFRQGDVLIRWNDEPLQSVRQVYALLGPESVGRSIEVGILRAAARTTLAIEIGERHVPQ